MSADPYDAVQDARSDRSEWTEGDTQDDAAEAFRWGFAPDGREPEAPSNRDAHVAATATLVCPRHGEMRPPMRMPVLISDLWRCPYCGVAMVLPSVAETNRKLQGAYLRV